MDRTTQLNKLAATPEDRMILARAADQMDAARQRNICAHTPFLSPHERVLVERLIAANGYPRAAFLGGYEEAERRVCVFLPDWMEEADPEEIGLRAIRATWRDEKPLTHRDFLGALMGMGISREKIGDLLVGEDHCDIILLEEVRQYLLQSMEFAGRSRLNLAEIKLEQVQKPETAIKTIRDTVAALRLDAVASAGFFTSRSRMAEYISSGKVNLNWQECTKPDAAVQAGDSISCRGLGKCKLTEVNGSSRKGRIMVVLERYI